MRKMMRVMVILCVVSILIGCQSLEFRDYYDYKVSQSIHIGNETYQYRYVYGYHVLISPKDELDKHKDYIVKFTLYDGDAEDAFSEVIVIKYYRVNSKTKIDDTLEYIYAQNYSLHPYKIETVEKIEDDYYKDFKLE